jgi:hypothetical protein
VVERCAVGHHPDRRPAGVVEVVALHRDHAVAARQRHAREVAEEVRQPGELGPGLVDRPAVVGGLQPVQRVEVGLERIGQAIDQPGARPEIHPAPFPALEGGPGRAHRPVDIGGT